MDNAVLTIHNLSKSYGKIQAVNQLSLEVQPGEIYGILGPNGSGKSTTLGMILGITKPDSGTFNWFGDGNASENRKRIGTLLETPNFYPNMNAIQNLNIVAHLKISPKNDFDEILKLVNLFDRKDSAFKTYSLGMKQRLAIAACLVGDPDVLIFDEPTNGLDPEGIAEVRNLLLKIAERGKTIIMASHILDEVEKICSHVMIIKKGNLLADGTVDGIINQQLTIEVAAKDQSNLREALSSCAFIESIEEDGGKLLLTVDENYSADAINQFCFERNITLSHLLVKQKSLEEEFLERTQNV